MPESFIVLERVRHPRGPGTRLNVRDGNPTSPPYWFKLRTEARLVDVGDRNASGGNVGMLMLHSGVWLASPTTSIGLWDLDP